MPNDDKLQKKFGDFIYNPLIKNKHTYYIRINSKIDDIYIKRYIRFFRPIITPGSIQNPYRNVTHGDSPAKVTLLALAG